VTYQTVGTSGACGAGMCGAGLVMPLAAALGLATARRRGR
jgi:hypothetical protein